MIKNENKIKGKVVDCLPNAQFKVEIENGKIVRAYAAGKIRINSIKIVIGDIVEMVVPQQGEIYRIVYRR
jgi:translation initiation factor IF-1